MSIDAADPLDIGADHVHADAAAGNGGDLAGGRKARREDERQSSAPGSAAPPARRTAGRPPWPMRTRASPSMPRPSSVDLDQDLVAGLAGGNAERAGRLLAGGGARLGLLDAMIDGVADDMGKRIADHLDHLAIELDVAAVHVEPDLLAEIGGKVADHARQAGEQAVDPLHAGAGDAVAYLGDAGGDALERRLDRDVARRIAQAPGELVAGKHGVGDGAHHPIEQVHREADRAHRAARVAAFGHGDFRLGDARRGLLAKRGDQLLVILAADRYPGLQRLDDLADPVDHGEHRIDQLGVGDPIAGANLGERAFGGVAQLLEPRQIEKSAIALHRVDEAENLVEPLAVLGIRLPCHDRPGQGLRHVAGFGDEIVEQLVHVGGAYERRW